MKIVDAHIHVGLQSFAKTQMKESIYNLCNTYENTIDLMDQYRVERAVIFPIPESEFDVQKSNEYIFEAYSNFPNRFIPFCRIDDMLEHNLSHGFQGVKLHLVYEHMEISDIKKELQIIEDSGVPLLLHAKFKDKVGQVENILKLAPKLRIILAHMGRGNLYTGEQVVDNALGLKCYPNVFFDTSTVGDIKAIVNVCEILGHDRVLYASDYPFGKNYQENYDYSQELKLILDGFKTEQASKIMGENLLTLLNLRSEDRVQVRQIKKSDLEDVVALIEKLSDVEKKFLALSSKYTLIKQVIRSERHCYIAHLHGKVVGFIRESGRPKGYSLLEEIIVSPEYRNKGIGNIMLQYYHHDFPQNIAKTNSENMAIIHLLQKNGYMAQNQDAPRIINWVRSKSNRDGIL